MTDGDSYKTLHITHITQNFICKQRYAHDLFLIQILLEKSPTDTYEFINQHCRNIVQEHVTKLSQRNLQLEEGMDCLPLTYWIPKIHKNSVGNHLLWHLQSVA